MLCAPNVLVLWCLVGATAQNWLAFRSGMCATKILLLANRKLWQNAKIAVNRNSWTVNRNIQIRFHSGTAFEAECATAQVIVQFVPCSRTTPAISTGSRCGGWVIFGNYSTLTAWKKSAKIFNETLRRGGGGMSYLRLWIRTPRTFCTVTHCCRVTVLR